MSVTHLLHEWSDGQPRAFDRLLNYVYLELSVRARRLMKREACQHTLQTDALVNEAYFRLVDLDEVDWQNRQHFYAVSAKIMRRILVDYARKKQSTKRGGDVVHVSLMEDHVQNHVMTRDVDIIALDRALEKLALVDELQQRIVELRYFSGLPVHEIACLLGVSESTVKRKWQFAQAWLYRELHSE